MNEMTDAERLIEARRLVLEHRSASISLIQRYMRIGYNAAARLMEELEKEGTVSAMGTTGVRQVLKADHEKDDSDRLKPCPFCGGAAEMDCVRSEAGDDPNEGGYFVACLACDCSTGLRFACGEDPRPLLIETWNRRTVQEPGRPRAVRSMKC